MKAWKIVQIIGFLILVLGVLVRMGGNHHGTQIAMTGLLVYLIGKVVLWLKSDKP